MYTKKKEKIEKKAPHQYSKSSGMVFSGNTHPTHPSYNPTFLRSNGNELLIVLYRSGVSFGSVLLQVPRAVVHGKKQESREVSADHRGHPRPVERRARTLDGAARLAAEPWQTRAGQTAGAPRRRPVPRPRGRTAVQPRGH